MSQVEAMEKKQTALIAKHASELARKEAEVTRQAGMLAAADATIQQLTHDLVAVSTCANAAISCHPSPAQGPTAANAALLALLHGALSPLTVPASAKHIT